MFDPSQFSYQQPHPPTLIPSQPYIVTDPYANFGSHLNWTPNFGYASVTQPGNQTTSLAVNPNSFWANQPVTAGATSNIPPQEAKVVQTVRCDVCNVDCNNKDVFEKHLQGKKHIRNLQARNNPMATMLATSNTVNHISLPNQIGIRALAVSASPDLEIKKIKVLNSGAAVDSVRVCTICNVVCNSLDVFNKHMLGRKHAVQANLAALGEVGPYFAAVRAQFESNYKKTPKKVKIVQSAWCEVCKISCNSSDAYATHITGKKHQNNLEQLRKLSNDPTSASTTSSLVSSTCPMIGPEENPAVNNSKSIVSAPKKASEEDMLAKRQKIVQAGTASALIRTCTVCNVVCNSLTVFNSHLGGQKHKDMLKKLQESGV